MTRELATMLDEVLSLQPKFSDQNTPEMERRGTLIRHHISDWLKDRLSALQGFVPTVDDLDVAGRDHTGKKSEIPWVRIHSRSLSPTPQIGWYVVYLFNALGDQVYLSLGHGSTKNLFEEIGITQYEPLSAEEVEALKGWALGRLGGALDEVSGLGSSMNLAARRTRLGRAYEDTTLRAFTYRAGSIPDDEELLEDLETLLGFLNVLYQGEQTDAAVPGKVAPEVAEALSGVAQAAGQGSAAGTRQGFGLTAAERHAVELQAMSLAEKYLVDNGWTVTDVSSKESFDLRAAKGDSSIKIEVKGTTSAGEKVILTRNEVKLHMNDHPDNGLIVVHHIELQPGERPQANGGSLLVMIPWLLDGERLEPIGYEYSVPHQGGSNPPITGSQH